MIRYVRGRRYYYHQADSGDRFACAMRDEWDGRGTAIFDWLRANCPARWRYAYNTFYLDGDEETPFYRIYFADKADAVLCEFTWGVEPPVLTETELPPDVPPEQYRYLNFSSRTGRVARWWPRRCGDGYFRAEYEGPRGGRQKFKSKKLKSVREWCRKQATC